MHRRQFVKGLASGTALTGLLGTPLARAGRALVNASPAADRVAYVALGDSLTFGHGADDPLRDNYPTLLARHLPPESLFLNLGRNGNTVIEVSGTDLDSATDARPTLITVQIGLNDLGNGVPLEKVQANFHFLLTTLRGTHARIVLLNYPNVLEMPGSEGATDFARTVVAYNRIIANEAAHQHAQVIDFYGVTKRIYGSPENVSSGFHLTSKGYAAMAERCYSVMHAHGAI